MVSTLTPSQVKFKMSVVKNRDKKMYLAFTM